MLEKLGNVTLKTDCNYLSSQYFFTIKISNPKATNKEKTFPLAGISCMDIHCLLHLMNNLVVKFAFPAWESFHHNSQLEKASSSAAPRIVLLVCCSRKFSPKYCHRWNRLKLNELEVWISRDSIPNVLNCYGPPPTHLPSCNQRVWLWRMW